MVKKILIISKHQIFIYNYKILKVYKSLPDIIFYNVKKVALPKFN